jgi:anthranilate phosphoribosyltransferase
LTGETKVFSSNGEQILKPSDFGLEKIRAEEIHGGETIEEAAKIFTDILKGEGTKAQNSVVYANSALALKAAGKYDSLLDATEAAKEAIESGKAYGVFKKLAP